jgi:sphingosine kinase
MIARGQTTQMDLSLYETTNQSYWSFLTFTFAMIADLDFESEVLRWLGSIRLEIWAVFCVARMRSYPARLSYLPKSQENAEFNMPSLSDPVPADWKVVEDDILLLWSSQVTHASESHYHSPPSHIHDGVFQILLVRGRVSRISMANILLSLEYGTHINHPKAEFIECAAYRLEPLKSGSFNDLDGELIEGGPVQAHVLPSAIQVFCSLAR